MFPSFFSSFTGSVDSSEPHLDGTLQEGVNISEHNFEDFSQLLALNDRISFELSNDTYSEHNQLNYQLNAPRVITCGLTSAGKSSLMERIIGHSIFPVKDKVCTRRPFRVQLKKDTSTQQTVLKFTSGIECHDIFTLPDQLAAVRDAIERAQESNDDQVSFSDQEIHAEISSPENSTFTFTDLPGIFLVSEKKMGCDYAKSREENERLKKQTLEITKKWISQKNTIVLVVISSTDWMHGMNNDNLISYLAEWLEEVRKEHDVPVYGVITKLDTQSELSSNSPIKKILLNQLPQDHILNGLKVRQWIPIVSSPAVLGQGIGEIASKMEHDAICACLGSSIPPLPLSRLPIGRSVLLKQLKKSLLVAISQTHGPMREKIDEFTLDLDKKLRDLPQTFSISEKRRIFDTKLQKMEEILNNLVGVRGRHIVINQQNERSLRVQLMVDVPAEFERNLNATKFRGNIIADVRQILNQKNLERGGSFDSDVTFSLHSQNFIQCFKTPCLDLVTKCSDIIAHALKKAAKESFGDYPNLEKCILMELGLNNQPGLDVNIDHRLFTFLTTSAKHKVLNLLDAFSSMACVHPMWRNFDVLYQNILLKEKVKNDNETKEKNKIEDTLQDMLNLHALSTVVKNEGQNAIVTFENETNAQLSASDKLNIKKHYARLEVMAYIIRSGLLGAVFPLVIRDLRDGLFRGVKYGSESWDHSMSTLLRMKLIFQEGMEAKTLNLMEPSPKDVALRTLYMKKRETLLSLKKEFVHCQSKLTSLASLLNNKKKAENIVNSNQQSKTKSFVKEQTMQ